MQIQCEHCKTFFNVDDKLAGRKGKCPKCKNIINIIHPEPEIPWNQPDVPQPPSTQSWDQPDDEPSFREPIIYGAVAKENKNKQMSTISGWILFFIIVGAVFVGNMLSMELEKYINKQQAQSYIENMQKEIQKAFDHK
ncbi:MAG: zinc-ribbon domain-containing protein [Thermoguttaceae bacterium]|jgi:predicted Zn finger-like uncharacterized protein